MEKDYDSRAIDALVKLNARDTDAARKLRGKLAIAIGWENNPRLIATVHEAEAYIKQTPGSNAAAVGPEARRRLSPLMRHYAGVAHPFTSCVRDNEGRFGRDRAERICAVLKDLIMGTTKWRGRKADGEATTDIQDVIEQAIELALQKIIAEIQTMDDLDAVETYLQAELANVEPNPSPLA